MHPGELSDEEIELWQVLCATRHELRSPFFSFEFTRAVAEAGARARVCVLYREAKPVGFFPFQFADRFSELMAAGQRIGGELNDFAGLVLDRHHRAVIGRHDVLQAARLASFAASHLESNQASASLNFGTHSQGARIRIARDPAIYWERVKSTHRYDYYERRAAREFREVAFSFADQRVDDLLRIVIIEKRKQYERTGKKDGFAEPWKSRCLSHIATYREGRCVPVLASLEFDGEWAALHFGIRAGNVLHYWFPVYNSKFSKYSPGLLLLAKMIGEATAHVVDEIDLGEGVSRYKEIFATELYPMYRDEWYRVTPRGIANRAHRSFMWRALRAKRSTGHTSTAGKA